MTHDLIHESTWEEGSDLDKDGSPNAASRLLDVV